MSQPLPLELQALLEASDAASQEAAWEGFLAEYSRTILATTEYESRDYDGAMNRYRFALEGLRADDFRRLRTYQSDPRSKFTTWLVVVVRHLCRDYERKRYGRRRSGASDRAREGLEVRRRLVDLLAERLDHHPERVAGNPPVLDRLELQELRSALRPALLQLPPEDRLLLKLRFEDDLSVRRITEVVQLPSVFHVYRRLKRSIRYLREALEERGYGE